MLECSRSLVVVKLDIVDRNRTYFNSYAQGAFKKTRNRKRIREAGKGRKHGSTVNREVVMF